MSTEVPVRISRADYSFPRVLILYSADHDLHNDCIRKLAVFLSQICNCEIKLDMWHTTQFPDRNLKKAWLWSEITKAEKVLIIFSKGTQHKWQASMAQRAVDDIASGEYGDMFVSGYKRASDEFERNPFLLRTKYVAAHMEYSQKTDILPEMYNTARYDIPNNLERLFFRLHSIPVHSPSISRHAQFLQPDLYTSSPEGAALQNAIEAMKALIRKMPNWYEAKIRRMDSDYRYSSLPNGGSPSQENDPMMNNFFQMGGGSSESIDTFSDIFHAVSCNPDCGCFLGTDTDMNWLCVDLEEDIPGRSSEAEFDIAMAMKESSTCLSDTESTFSVEGSQDNHHLMTLDSIDFQVHEQPSHISRMDRDYDFMSDMNPVSQPLMKDNSQGASV